MTVASVPVELLPYCLGMTAAYYTICKVGKHIYPILPTGAPEDQVLYPSQGYFFSFTENLRISRSAYEMLSTTQKVKCAVLMIITSAGIGAICGSGVFIGTAALITRSVPTTTVFAYLGSKGALAGSILGGLQGVLIDPFAGPAARLNPPSNRPAGG